MDPNALASGSAGTASQYSFSSNWMGWLGGAATIVGIALLIVANQTNITNDTVKQNYNLSGSIFLIVGVAVFAQNFGLLTALKAAASTDDRRKAITTIVVVLLTTIAIFTALFYNYATGETLSFATAILVILIVAGVFFSLFMFSGKIPIANLISRSLLILFYFMPYAFFTFGIVADIITRQLQFTGASFAGMTAALLNYAISLTVNNGITPEVKTPLCEIPGLAFLSSTLMPQSMVTTLTTIAYIATFISRSPPGGPTVVSGQYIWPSWALLFGVFALQWGMLANTGCLTVKEGEYFTNGNYKAVAALLFSLLWGGSLGAIGYTVLDERADTGGAVAAGGSPVLGATGASTTPTVGTCSAGSSDGEFICESFENGKLKRTVMTE